MISNTPYKMEKIGNHKVLVKHEEMCAPSGAPPFSKLRGVINHLSKIQECDIGVLDTVHSKAGWAVAWACNELKNGKAVTVFYPSKEGQVPKACVKAQELGARLVALKPGRSAILFHQAKREMLRVGGYMMPNALKLEESVIETAQELVISTDKELLVESALWVVPVSSGTIAAGVIRGLHELSARPKVVLHMGYERSIQRLEEYVMKMAKCWWNNIHCVNQGYSYADKVEFQVDFPCNEFYDAKTALWISQQEELPQVTVFWNIGG